MKKYREIYNMQNNELNNLKQKQEQEQGLEYEKLQEQGSEYEKLQEQAQAQEDHQSKEEQKYNRTNEEQNKTAPQPQDIFITPPNSPRIYQEIINEALDIRSKRKAAIAKIREQKKAEREKNKNDQNLKINYVYTNILFSTLNQNCKINKPLLPTNFEDDEDQDPSLEDNSSLNIVNTSQNTIKLN